MRIKDSKRFAFVGPFRFPDDSAPSRRISGIGLSIRDLGGHVLIGSGQSSRDLMSNLDRNTLPFSIYSLDELPESKTSRLKKVVHVLSMGERTRHWLNALDPHPDVVFIFGGYVPYSRSILPWCRQNKIPVVIDVVEWFQPSHLPGGWLGPFHWNVELALRHYYVRAGNIIAISQYLDNYYRERGCNSLRMPPTLDVKNTSVRLTANDGRITLAYAGFPGKKDLIGSVIEAILKVDPQGERFRLVIAGPQPDDILRLTQLDALKLSALPSCIEAVGLLSHNQVLELVRNADFMPLLRPPLRYAMAGFPTKVPESLAVGTPVICNLTSDLGEYIHDGVEGLLCRDHSVDAFAEALERALLLSPQQRLAMRKAARQQAERSFDYRVYTEPLAAFLHSVRS